MVCEMDKEDELRPEYEEGFFKDGIRGKYAERCRKKDTSIIPIGMYCYDKNGKCPYWDINKDKPSQENGYCHFLGEGDWESEHLSLLWDQCKECGENEEERDGSGTSDTAD